MNNHIYSAYLIKRLMHCVTKGCVTLTVLMKALQTTSSPCFLADSSLPLIKTSCFNSNDKIKTRYANKHQYLQTV